MVMCLCLYTFGRVCFSVMQRAPLQSGLVKSLINRNPLESQVYGKIVLKQSKKLCNLMELIRTRMLAHLQPLFTYTCRLVYQYSWILLLAVGKNAFTHILPTFRRTLSTKRHKLCHK